MYIDIHHKSLAGDTNRPHFRYALLIEWERNRSQLSQSIYIPQWQLGSARNHYGDKILLQILSALRFDDHFFKYWFFYSCSYLAFD